MLQTLFVLSNKIFSKRYRILPSFTECTPKRILTRLTSWKDKLGRMCDRSPKLPPALCISSKTTGSSSVLEFLWLWPISTCKFKIKDQMHVIQFCTRTEKGFLFRLRLMEPSIEVLLAVLLF